MPDECLTLQDRKISVLGRHWHPEHFKCCECGTLLSPSNFKERNGKLYCEKDFNDKFMPKCAGCNTPVLNVITHTFLLFSRLTFPRESLSNL